MDGRRPGSRLAFGVWRSAFGGWRLAVATGDLRRLILPRANPFRDFPARSGMTMAKAILATTAGFD